MYKKISPIFVVTLASCILSCSLSAQTISGYTGIWNVQTPGALFRKLAIMPIQQESTSLTLTLWYPCPEGLCAIPDVEAMVVGGERNNLLVAEVQFPGKDFAFPITIFRSSFSNSLQVRIKQDVDHTQLFTFTQFRKGGSLEGDPPPSTDTRLASQEEPSDRRTSYETRQREVRETSDSDSAIDDVFREEGTAPSLFSGVAESGSQVVFSPGKVILPHCFSCPSYQLVVSNGRDTQIVDPELGSSRRWECELPELTEGEYTLEVVLKEGFGDGTPPPYKGGNIIISAENNESLTLVLQRN